MAEKLRVSEVAIKGLFGLYDHIIPLNARDRVTIVHGPNGVGKTVLLRCLAALFAGRYSVLRATPFVSFSVKLSDGTEVVVRREVGNAESDAKRVVGLSAELRGPGRSQRVELKTSADVFELAKRFERETPWLIQVGEQTFFDERTGKNYSAEEILESHSEFTRSSRLSKLRNAEPDALRQIRDRVRIRFIETNRLYRVSDEARPYDAYGRRGGASVANTVNEYAKQLHAQIEAALAQYGRKSQQLDQSFPQRLIQDDVEALSLDALKARLETLEARHQQLSQIGLLDKVPAQPFDPATLDNVAQHKLVPMTLYLLDNEEKIAVFDGLASRAQLLLESVNRKFRNKKLVVNKESGLSAVGSKDEPLSLDALSSGEQHEIVLLFELLFSTSPDTLVLIDEPELSLHVTWQKMFLPELLAATSQVGFDVIIATHSPFVVGGRRDLMVALDAEPDDDDDDEDAL